MLILSVPSVLAFLRCNRTCSPSKQEGERWPVQFFGEIKRSHSSVFPNVSCSPLSVLSFFIEHYLLPSPTSPAQTGYPLAHRKHTSRALNAYYRISPWYKAGSREVVLGGGGREGSLKGAPPPPPLETWRAVPFRPRAALGHTPTPTSPSQECGAGEAHAGKETAGRAGRKGGGI